LESNNKEIRKCGGISWNLQENKQNF
jgi:hypothetical protein